MTLRRLRDDPRVQALMERHRGRGTTGWGHSGGPLTSYYACLLETCPTCGRGPGVACTSRRPHLERRTLSIERARRGDAA